MEKIVIIEIFINEKTKTYKLGESIKEMAWDKNYVLIMMKDGSMIEYHNVSYCVKTQIIKN